MANYLPGQSSDLKGLLVSVCVGDGGGRGSLNFMYGVNKEHTAQNVIGLIICSENTKLKPRKRVYFVNYLQTTW